MKTEISSHKTVKLQENEIAQKLNGQRQPGSGAFEWAKGDVTSDEFLLEAKQTAKMSFSIKGSVLEKIDAEAMAVNKYPLLAFRFLNMSPRSCNEWVAMPMYLFEEMVSAWRKEESDDTTNYRIEPVKKKKSVIFKSRNLF